MAIPEATVDKPVVKVHQTKRGANFSDQNRIRKLEAMGYLAQEISVETKIAVDVVKSFMEPKPDTKKKAPARRKTKTDEDNWAE